MKVDTNCIIDLDFESILYIYNCDSKSVRTIYQAAQRTLLTAIASCQDMRGSLDSLDSFQHFSLAVIFASLVASIVWKDRLEPDSPSFIVLA